MGQTLRLKKVAQILLKEFPSLSMIRALEIADKIIRELDK